MKFNVTGTVMQSINFELNKGESIIAERGAMNWMSENMDMTTSTIGVKSAIKRWFGGESFFLTKFTCNAGTSILSFGLDIPGKIIPLEVSKGKEYICQKDSFLCAVPTVKLGIEFRKKFGRGFFGGEGFVLQRLSGKGLAFIEVAGEVLEYDLKKGQTLRVDTGSIAMYEPKVDYDIERIKGTRNILFGGEGIFLATLTGPGKVWLQTMTARKLAGKIFGSVAPRKRGIMGFLGGK